MTRLRRVPSACLLTIRFSGQTLECRLFRDHFRDRSTRILDGELMELYFAQRQFTMYGPSHWAVIAMFAIGSVLLVWIGRRQSPSQARILGRILGALTATIFGVVLVDSLYPPTIGRSVPLNLTDLATAASAYALWSPRHWAFALTYYWGLVLSTQALISPVLTGPDFPDYRFLGFWSIHLLVIWAAIYLTWGPQNPAQLAQLSHRRDGHPGLGSRRLHVQPHRWDQLRLPQRKTPHPKPVRRAGPLAGVPPDCDHSYLHRVGTDDLAVGPFHGIPTVDQRMTGSAGAGANTR